MLAMNFNTLIFPKNQRLSSKGFRQMNIQQNVTFIIPIYRKVELLKRLWHSLLEHTHWNRVAKVILINDSPDDQNVIEWVQNLPPSIGATSVTFLQNETNLGFPLTCNRGFAAREQGTHAVILNTDIIVQSRWLDKMLHCFEEAVFHQVKVASITPSTNNGTILIVPERNQVYDVFPGLNSPAALNKLAEIHYGKHDPLQFIPVGVGFCMLLNDQALNLVGSFDPLFSPGYGEEVDWCLRAAEQGYKSLWDNATFIYHQGGESFGPQKLKLQEDHEREILRRYPYYHARLRHYVQMEAPYPMNLLFKFYWQIAARLKHAKISLLITTLDPFKAVGGVEKFCLEQSQHLLAEHEQECLILARKLKSDTEQYTLFNAVGQVLAQGQISDILHLFTILEQAYLIKWQCLTIHHWLRWAIDEGLQVCEYFHVRQIRQRTYLHDYYLLSEIFTLIPDSPIPDSAANFPLVDFKALACNSENLAWQQQFHPLLHLSELLICPSQASSEIFSAALSNDALRQKLHVRPHLQIVASIAKPLRKKAKTRLCLAFLGMERYVKGAYLFFELIQKFNSHMDFLFIGESQYLLKNPLVKTLKYNFHNDDVVQILQRETPDAICLFSLWPEPFGYTLYEAIAAGIPILTLNSSGNIRDVVTQWEIGKVFQDQAELVQWLSGDEQIIRQNLEYWAERLRHCQTMPNPAEY